MQSHHLSGSSDPQAFACAQAKTYRNSGSSAAAGTSALRETPTMKRFEPNARLASAFAAFTLVASAQAVVAAPAARLDGDPAAVAVSYADLDLRRAGDAQKLLVRLEAASRAVCDGFIRGRRGIEPWQARQRCRSSALAKSVSVVGSSQLNALYAARATDGFVLADQRE
ncbi:MAG TPA: UrcA family protein [Phenylobacterium sp.]|jgi:UrcA family protein